MDFNEYRRRLRERMVPAAFVEEAVCIAEQMLSGEPAPAEEEADPTHVELTVPVPTEGQQQEPVEPAPSPEAPKKKAQKK